MRWWWLRLSPESGSKPSNWLRKILTFPLATAFTNLGSSKLTPWCNHRISDTLELWLGSMFWLKTSNHKVCLVLLHFAYFLWSKDFKCLNSFLIGVERTAELSLELHKRWRSKRYLGAQGHIYSFVFTLSLHRNLFCSKLCCLIFTT